MATGRTARSVLGALELLERAIGYARSSLHLVTPDRMDQPTPCHGWDVQTLLRHMDDSLAALQEAADVGYVDLDAGECGDDASIGVVTTVRTRLSSLLGTWTDKDGAELIFVAGCPLSAGLLASTGALEIAVHGWDVGRACGQRQPFPPSLAEELLELAPLLVKDLDRPARFAPPVDVPAQAPAEDRLLGFLGRRP